MTTTLAVLAADALRYVLPHVSKEESRPIIHGMLCEPSGVVAATNGRTMCLHAGGSEGVTRPVILKFEKPATVTGRKVHHVTLEIPDAPDYHTPLVVTMRTSHGIALGATLAYEIEGPFPNVRGIVPTEGTEEPQAVMAFDPTLLALFAVDGDSVTLDFYGPQKPVGVRFTKTGRAYGLVIPIPTHGHSTTSIDWIRGTATRPPLALGATFLSERYAAAEVTA